MAISDFVEQMIGQYTLVHLIGQDSFADNYLAYDAESDRHVLMSVLAEHFSEDNGLRLQYSKRARVLSRIRHPNIAVIYDVGELKNNRPYIISEHFEGFPLDDRLNKLAEQESPAHVVYALTLIRQIASGLSLAERLGCFHYQLTPKHIFLRNVTLKADDSAVVVNLDIPPEFTGVLGSTIEADQEVYLSPEQLRNSVIDGRSHVYSLGIILFQLLTRTIPSQEKSIWRRPIRAIGHDVSDLKHERDDLSPETYELVARSIHPKPASRYASLHEFVDVLDRAIAAEDLRIHTEDIGEARRPKPIFVAPFLLLLICVALATAVWMANPSNSSATLPNSTMNDNPSTVIVAAQLSSQTPTAPVTGTVSKTLEMPSRTNFNSPNLNPTKEPLTTNKTEKDVPVISITFKPTTELLPTNTPTSLPTSTAKPTATRILATPWPKYHIAVSSASLRQGPDLLFDVESYLYKDEQVTIIGKNENINTWFVVETADGRIGWISASVGHYVETRAVDSIPLAATIPSPPPTWTPTPTDTPLPTDTPSLPLQPRNSGNNDEDKPRPRSTPTPPL